MKKITLFLTALLVTVSVFAEVSLTKMWEVSEVMNNKPAWLAADNNRDIAVLGDKLYVISKAEKALRVIDLTNEDKVAAVTNAEKLVLKNPEEIGVGYNSLSVSDDGKLFILCSFPNKTLQICEVNLSDGQLTTVLSKCPDGAAIGRFDFFNVYGNFTSGKGYIFATTSPSSGSGGKNAYRWTATDGVVDADNFNMIEYPSQPVSRALSSSARIYPYAADKFIVSSRNTLPTIYNVTEYKVGNTESAVFNNPSLLWAAKEDGQELASGFAFADFNGKRIGIFNYRDQGGIVVHSPVGDASFNGSKEIAASRVAIGTKNSKKTFTAPILARQVAYNEVEIYQMVPNNGLVAYKLADPYFLGDIYLKVNPKWLEAGAKTEVYFTNDKGEESWQYLAPIAYTKDVFKVTVPADKHYTKVQFNRVNPKDGMNKWNQTAVFDIATVGNNDQFVVTEEGNNVTNGTWSVYTPAQHTFTVVGDFPCFAGDWAPTASANDLADEDKDGVYTKVYQGVDLVAKDKEAVKYYKYKVAVDHAWDFAYGDPENSTNDYNATFSVPVDGKYDLTFTFNTNGNLVSCSAVSSADVAYNDLKVEVQGWEDNVIAGTEIWVEYAGGVIPALSDVKGKYSVDQYGVTFTISEIVATKGFASLSNLYAYFQNPDLTEEQKNAEYLLTEDMYGVKFVYNNTYYLDWLGQLNVTATFTAAEGLVLPVVGQYVQNAKVVVKNAAMDNFVLDIKSWTVSETPYEISPAESTVEDLKLYPYSYSFVKNVKWDGVNVTDAVGKTYPAIAATEDLKPLADGTTSLNVEGFALADKLIVTKAEEYSCATIAEILALPADSEVKFKGNATATFYFGSPYGNTNGIFIQDETGVIKLQGNLFKNGHADQKVKTGMSVTEFTGKLSTSKISTITFTAEQLAAVKYTGAEGPIPFEEVTAEQLFEKYPTNLGRAYKVSAVVTGSGNKSVIKVGEQSIKVSLATYNNQKDKAVYFTKGIFAGYITSGFSGDALNIYDKSNQVVEGLATFSDTKLFYKSNVAQESKEQIEITTPAVVTNIATVDGKTVLYLLQINNNKFYNNALAVVSENSEDAQLKVGDFVIGIKGYFTNAQIDIEKVQSPEEDGGGTINVAKLISGSRLRQGATPLVKIEGTAELAPEGDKCISNLIKDQNATNFEYRQFTFPKGTITNEAGVITYSGVDPTYGEFSAPLVLANATEGWAEGLIGNEFSVNGFFEAGGAMYSKPAVVIRSVDDLLATEYTLPTIAELKAQAEKYSINIIFNYSGEALVTNVVQSEGGFCAFIEDASGAACLLSETNFSFVKGDKIKAVSASFDQYVKYFVLSAEQQAAIQVVSSDNVVEPVEVTLAELTGENAANYYHRYVRLVNVEQYSETHTDDMGTATQKYLRQGDVQIICGHPWVTYPTGKGLIVEGIVDNRVIQYDYFTIYPTKVEQIVVAAPVLEVVEAEKSVTISATCEDGAVIKYSFGEDDVLGTVGVLDYVEALNITGTNETKTINFVAVKYGTVYSEVVTKSIKFGADGAVALDNAFVAPSIYVENRAVVADCDFQIFSITGQNVTEYNGSLENGVYVVRTANAATKVIIR